MKPYRIRLPGSALGTYAQEHRGGRWLWSVRWPAHECYRLPRSEDEDGNELPERWHCTVGDQYGKVGVPQLFRYGHADTEEAAKAAIHEAYAEGRPERSGSAQYVKA